MISKKYSLREAFEKRLLESDDEVNIAGLYKPLRKIVRKDSWGTLSVLSLYSYFGESAFQQVEIQKASDGAIVVCFYKKDTTSNIANLVASRLLSDDLYGVKASCNLYSKDGFRENWRFTVVLNPDIIVRFEGIEEVPYLELPPHVAYTC